MKKNPHKNRSDMKLYLEFQVKERAMQVHESMENIEEKKEIRILNLHKTRQKNYEKKLQGIEIESHFF
jgi:DNA-repair protein complementing XP-A cells